MNLNEMRKIAGIPLKEDFDPKQTAVEAAKLIKMLKGQFPVPIDDKTNDDGSVTITLNNGKGSPNGSDANNSNVVTAKTLSAAIDKPFREFRAKGWAFTQPQNYAFTIGVKA